MIKIENTEVYGWEAAIRGMRNPKNSWEKSDSCYCKEPITAKCNNSGCSHCGWAWTNLGKNPFCIGDNDLTLMQKLVRAGTDHRKFMRMITVSCDITAPLYWWAEYDTYKVGTVRNSCSKMHKLLHKPFEMSDFSFDKLTGYKNEVPQFKPDFDEKDEVWKSLNPWYSVSNWPANKSQEAKWNFYKIFTEEKVGTTNRPSKRSEKRNAVVSERSSGCAVLAFRIDE